MINFEQILEWVRSISRLSKDVQPVIKEIKEGVRIKTIGGIQFIESPDDPLKSIQDLNKALEQYGLETIDEEAFKKQFIDLQELSVLMQSEFSQDELSATLAPGTSRIEPKDFSDIEFSLADLCAPVEEDQGKDFNESEILNAACEIPVIKEGNQIPIIPVPIKEATISLEDNELPLPPLTDDIIAKAAAEMRDGLTSDLFDTNGPDCFRKMQEVSKSVEKDIQIYNKVKESLQEIQMDYYYQALVYDFYDSFIQGYGEFKEAREKGLSDRARDLLSSSSSLLTRSDLEKEIKASLFRFSTQFKVEIDTGFLGLFRTSPSVYIDKEIGLDGEIKTIPDALISYIDSVDKSLPDSPKNISKEAKESERRLEKSFFGAIEKIKYLSRGFGIGEASKQNEIDQEFLDRHREIRDKFKGLENRYMELKAEEKRIEERIDNIQMEISVELSKLNCEQNEMPFEIEPGGIPNFKNVSNGPTIFNYTWWKKFSEYATLVNLVPVHWPVGLIIPTPSGIIKIPFPIIWIPLFVAGSSKMLSVLFIGQCGILPCPFVYFQHFLEIPLGSFESNNPYFIVAMRGPINIRSHKPLPPNTLPSFDLLFRFIDEALDNYRKGIDLNLDAFISEISNQLDQINASANRYAAISDKEISDIIKNAKDQANLIISSAKESAQAVIKQAQEDGDAKISEILARYNNTEISFPQIKQIRDQINEEIKLAQDSIEAARKKAKVLIENSDSIAKGLKERAAKTLNEIAESGKRAYEQKLKELEQIRELGRDSLKTLAGFIDRIKVPAIDISSIDLNSLLESYKLSLGSMKALAADLSPQVIEFGFPKEISPQFSQILPILDDDLPPWERLTLLNIPFLLFLWKWCQAGKKKGGFFENVY